jgi:acyl-CoA synthetase (AMP-forming)/AMP-acid ligase II
MDRFWLKSYPPGVPSDIDPSVYPSVVALLEESFAKYRDQRAYVCMDKAITFGDVDALSKALAAWLQGRGLAKGARVAIMMPNVLQYPVALAAVLRAGLIAVNVNPLYTARELAHQLKDSGAEAVIVLENFAATLEQALAGTAVKHVVVASMGDLLGFPKGLIVNFVVRTMRKMVPAFSLPGHTKFNDAVSAGRSMSFARPDIGPGDVAVLQYTGGTTGVAKGATLLHHTIVANLLASEAWMQPGLKRKNLTGQFTIVCALPLYHVFAFIACGLLGMRTGALNILIPNPRDMKGTIAELAKYRINIFPGVNTLFNGLANQPDFAKLDFSQLAISNGGGMAVQEAVAKKWLAITGCPIVEGYGLSETSAGVTCNPTDSAAQRRDQDPRRPGQGGRVGRGRRDRHQGPAGHARLLAASGRDGAGHDARRLLQVGRCRRDGCPRLHQDRGSQEGHDRRLGLQGLPQRDRRRGREPSRRPRMCRHRRARCGLRRGRHAVRGEEGSRAHQGGASGVVRPAVHRLQAAEIHRVPRRAAQDQCRQDPAARIARQHAEESGLI